MTARSGNAITPPATLGILGGGQLGRYFVVAARTMGYRTVVLEPDPDAPAGAVADEHLIAAFDDQAALQHLADVCAVVTTEFENPPAAAMEWLSIHTIVRPSPARGRHRPGSPRREAVPQPGRHPDRAVHGDRDRRPRARRHRLRVPGDLEDGPPRLRRQGADRRRDSTTTLATAWDRLDRQPCVLEQRMPLQSEVSVVLARSASGQVAAYPVAENTHAGGILDCTVVPCSTSPAIARQAERRRRRDRRGARLRRRARRGDVRRRRPTARQRARTASAQQRPLDARRRSHQPVRAAGARRVRPRRSGTRRCTRRA